MPALRSAIDHAGAMAIRRSNETSSFCIIRSHKQDSALPETAYAGNRIVQITH